jgi:hypothetical protein
MHLQKHKNTDCVLEFPLNLSLNEVSLENSYLKILIESCEQTGVWQSGKLNEGERRK